MAELADHFATLGIDRAVALEESVVRERFHELSRQLHPDTDGGDELAFAAINEAQRVLASPAARIRHLLELEFGKQGDGAVASGKMSAALMDLFASVGGVISKADALISKRKAASSAVAKALLVGEEIEVQQSLMKAGGELMARRREVEGGLGEIGIRDRESLSGAAHELAFLEKWQRQVQERVAALI